MSESHISTMSPATTDTGLHGGWVTQAILFLATFAAILYWMGTGEGLWYAAGLLPILLAHEFGHYFAARRYGIPVTLPYFIPGIPPLNTFGAFIKMEPRPMSREALLVIGAAGPIAGMIVAVPVYAIGLWMSSVESVGGLAEPGLMQLGDSLLGWGLVELMHSPQTGSDVFIHPLGFAGWVGFFVTSLNLIPVGQLDGGHIAFAMFGKRWHRAARIFFGLLVLAGAILHPVWLVMGVFLLFTGVEHPPITRQKTELPGWCRTVGWVCLVIFALTLMPSPIGVKPLPLMIAELF